jgi:hypothetical protein
MATSPTVDESFARLHRAGWSVGDARIRASEDMLEFTLRRFLQ